jgi:hypothetical protein
LNSRWQIANDRTPISIPTKANDEKYGEAFAVNSYDRFARGLDLRTHAYALNGALGGTGGDEAANVNAFEEVPDSTWFTNRNAWNQISDEAIERGQTRERMASDGPLLVVSGKGAGVTPGFFVKDQNGNRFLLKFDPPENCGMASTADVVGSRLMWAAGYNVPENNVEWIDQSRLVLDPKATTGGKYKKKVPMTEDVFEKLKGMLPPCTNDAGHVLALASRLLDGKLLGPFTYEGRRLDDPNDHIRHKNRRELRGLSVMAAWLQHTDFRGLNTLDTFVETAENKGYVLHYLIDLGSTLGSQGTSAKTNDHGHEYVIDFHAIVLDTMAFGGRAPSWKHDVPSAFPSVGNYNADHFDPGSWRPKFPNAAMLARTKRDGFWGARLVASFTDSQLAAVLRATYLPREAGAELFRVLVARRDSVARYWFSKVGGLDRFSVDGDSSQIRFLDWQRNGPWAPSTAAVYRWELKGAPEIYSGEATTPTVPIAFDLGPKSDRQFRLRITPTDGKQPTAPWTEATFVQRDDGKLVCVGVSRDVR